MTNLEKLKQSPEKYSPQVVLLIENYAGEFPFAQFEEWVRKEKFVIGGGYLIEFLELRKEKAQNEIKKLTNLPDVQ